MRISDRLFLEPSDRLYRNIPTVEIIISSPQFSTRFLLFDLYTGVLLPAENWDRARDTIFKYAFKSVMAADHGATSGVAPVQPNDTQTCKEPNEIVMLDGT